MVSKSSSHLLRLFLICCFLSFKSFFFMANCEAVSLWLSKADFSSFKLLTSLSRFWTFNEFSVISCDKLSTSVSAFNLDKVASFSVSCLLIAWLQLWSLRSKKLQGVDIYSLINSRPIIFHQFFLEQVKDDKFLVFKVIFQHKKSAESLNFLK